tara:strand:+ start:1381 stop:1734 length:354 start_codon:yes stop_codon:yes gene_type:complete
MTNDEIRNLEEALLARVVNLLDEGDPLTNAAIYLCAQLIKAGRDDLARDVGELVKRAATVRPLWQSDIAEAHYKRVRKICTVDEALAWGMMGIQIEQMRTAELSEAFIVLMSRRTAS